MMDGWTTTTCLTSGLEVKAIASDGYYEVRDGADVVFMSETAMIELFRKYALEEKAKLVIISAEWPAARIEHWRACHPQSRLSRAHVGHIR